MRTRRPWTAMVARVTMQVAAAVLTARAVAYLRVGTTKPTAARAAKAAQAGTAGTSTRACGPVGTAGGRSPSGPGVGGLGATASIVTVRLAPSGSGRFAGPC